MRKDFRVDTMDVRNAPGYEEGFPGHSDGWEKCAGSGEAFSGHSDGWEKCSGSGEGFPGQCDGREKYTSLDRSVFSPVMDRYNV